VQAYAADASREQPVTVRADAQTPHQAVITAMDVLGQLGFSRISLATVRSGEGG
jgi:biopolymer transport protein ExbD